MDKYIIAKENLERLNEWTCTLYTLVHALKIGKDINFQPLDKLNESTLESMNWEKDKNNFDSITHRVTTKSKKVVIFRRDPSINFNKTVKRIAYMLIQDLVIIFDEILNDLMVEENINVQNFPQSKIEALKKYVNNEFAWSTKGCMELIAVRNAITHSKGKWNGKSLQILKENGIIDAIKEIELLQKEVIVTIPMVFEYKKSIRTFMNQVKSGKTNRGKLKANL